MKKVLVLLLALLFAFSFVACEDDDDKAIENTPKAITYEDLIGAYFAVFDSGLPGSARNHGYATWEEGVSKMEYFYDSRYTTITINEDKTIKVSYKPNITSAKLLDMSEQFIEAYDLEVEGNREKLEEKAKGGETLHVKEDMQDGVLNLYNHDEAKVGTITVTQDGKCIIELNLSNKEMTPITSL